MQLREALSPLREMEMQLQKAFPQLRKMLSQLRKVLAQLQKVLPQLRKVLAQLQKAPDRLHGVLMQLHGMEMQLQKTPDPLHGRERAVKMTALPGLLPDILPRRARLPYHALGTEYDINPSHTQQKAIEEDSS